MVANNIVWRASPSQWINATRFAGAVVLFIILIAVQQSGGFTLIFDDYLFFLPAKKLIQVLLMLLPILMAVWYWLQVKFRVYELTDEVFRESFGVFDRTTQELELYRVNDTMTYKPFELNIMGMGNVILHTSDASDPTVLIAAVKEPDKVRQMIRHYVEINRQRKGIVEVANR